MHTMCVTRDRWKDRLKITPATEDGDEAEVWNEKSPYDKRSRRNKGGITRRENKRRIIEDRGTAQRQKERKRTQCEHNRGGGATGSAL